MIKKSITFENFDGEKVTEDHYFHLNKANLMEMEVESETSLSEEIEMITKTDDAPKVVKIFKKFVLEAYGVRSEDGKKFIKNDQIREDFKNSEAFSELLYEMISEPQAALELIRGILPADLLEEAEKKMSGSGDSTKQEIARQMKALQEEKASDKKEEKNEKNENSEDLTSLSQEELIERLKNQSK